MWYVIQTTTGKEQELVDVIHKMLPPDSYRDCFFLKRKLLKRLGGEWLEVTETLFPAYVFLDMDEPEEMFYHLKKVPELAKILGDNSGEFIPLEEEEAGFLKVLCSGKKENEVRKDDGKAGEHRTEEMEHLVKLTKVYLDERGNITRFKGPLEYFQEKIVRLNLRKRFAIIEMIMRGERQTALLGIKIEKN